MNTFRHHGDVTICPFNGKIEGEQVKHNGSLTLALGEVTGHSHVLTVPKLDDMDAVRLPDGGWLLTLRAEGTLTHQEHKPIVVPVGTYRVGKEREYDHFAHVVRRVID